MFDVGDFYMAYDTQTLLHDLRNSLEFIASYWRMPMRPLFLFLLREDDIQENRKATMLQVRILKPPYCWQCGREVKGVVFATTLIACLSRNLFTLWCPWLRRFTVINSVWLFQTSSKFTWEVNQKASNMVNSLASENHLSKSINATVASSWGEDKHYQLIVAQNRKLCSVAKCLG